MPFINSKTLLFFTRLSILSRVRSSRGGASDPALSNVTFRLEETLEMILQLEYPFAEWQRESTAIMAINIMIEGDISDLGCNQSILSFFRSVACGDRYLYVVFV